MINWHAGPRRSHRISTFRAIRGERDLASHWLELVVGLLRQPWAGSNSLATHVSLNRTRWSISSALSDRTASARPTHSRSRAEPGPHLFTLHCCAPPPNPAIRESLFTRTSALSRIDGRERGASPPAAASAPRRVWLFLERSAKVCDHVVYHRFQPSDRQSRPISRRLKTVPLGAVRRAAS